MALKVAPPLVVNEAQLDDCVAAIEQVVDLLHTSKKFWAEALAIGRRVLTSI